MKKASQKVMKFGEYKELDETLYIWFRQQRELALQQRRELLSSNRRFISTTKINA